MNTTQNAKTALDGIYNLLANGTEDQAMDLVLDTIYDAMGKGDIALLDELLSQQRAMGDQGKFIVELGFITFCRPVAREMLTFTQFRQWVYEKEKAKDQDHADRCFHGLWDEYEPFTTLLPATLVSVAKRNGISVPPDINAFEKKDYLHWWTFVSFQLYTHIPSGDALEFNAKAVSAIPAEKLEGITLAALLKDYNLKAGLAGEAA